MDNIHIDVTSEGKESLGLAIEIAFRMNRLVGRDRRGRPLGVTHYALRQASDGVPNDRGGWAYGQEPRPFRIVFFNLYEGTATKDDKVALPFITDAQGLTYFVEKWLEQVEYPSEPDHDGSNGKGWRLYNEASGRVDGDHSAVLAVSPEWATYGK